MKRSPQLSWLFSSINHDRKATLSTPKAFLANVIPYQACTSIYFIVVIILIEKCYFLPCHKLMIFYDTSTTSSRTSFFVDFFALLCLHISIVLPWSLKYLENSTFIEIVTIYRLWHHLAITTDILIGSVDLSIKRSVPYKMSILLA